jgi:hypothetical protein
VEEIIKLVFGIIALVLGIPIGNLLQKMTKEELKIGRPWFKYRLLFSCRRNSSLLFLERILDVWIFLIAIVDSRA